MEVYYKRIKRAGRMDVKPGMYLREKELIGMSGVTRFSLLFWNEIKGKIGEVVRAEMKIDRRENWRLWLFTKDDVKIVLYGCSAGYFGEGPRGTEQILKDAGFNGQKVEEIVFKEQKFVMKRRGK